MSLNIEEDIQRIKTLTYPPYSMAFSGVEDEVVLKVISQLFDDLTEEEYALFDEEEELIFLEPDNIYHSGLKQKVKDYQ